MMGVVFFIHVNIFNTNNPDRSGRDASRWIGKRQALVAVDVGFD